MRRTPARAVAGLAVTVLALSGCSAGKQVADEIKQQFDEQIGIEVSVSCPKDAKAQSAAAFDCTATYKAVDMMIHIVFTDETHFTYTAAGLAGSSAVAAKSASAFIAAQGGTVDQIDCGTDPVFVPSASSFTCAVTSAGQTVNLAFTVDSVGSVSAEAAA